MCPLADLSKLGLSYAQQLKAEDGATIYLPDAVRLQIDVGCYSTAVVRHLIVLAHMRVSDRATALWALMDPRDGLMCVNRDAPYAQVC